MRYLVHQFVFITAEGDGVFKVHLFTRSGS